MVINFEYHGLYVRKDRERYNTLTVIVKDFSMFQISFWYNKGYYDQSKVKHIAIRCSNSGKQTGLYMDNMNTKYKYIITSFLLNKVLHHVVLSRIIKTNKQLQYDIDKHNSDYVTGGPWYNQFF